MATFVALHCNSVEFLLPRCSQNLEQGITQGGVQAMSVV